METLIIYDDKGTVFTQITGGYIKPVGLQHLEAEIPQGKIIVGVDTTVNPNQPILEDIPKSETELLQEENMTLKLAVAELAESQEQAKLETQLALAELAETLIGGIE